MPIMHQEIRDTNDLGGLKKRGGRDNNWTWREPPVYYCLICKRLWEKSRNYDRGGILIHYYSTEVLTTFGRGRKTCPECEVNRA